VQAPAAVKTLIVDNVRLQTSYPLAGIVGVGPVHRGMFDAGPVPAPDSQTRAQMFQDYVDSALDHPAFAGCHWFQYLDEPLTGRALDGENSNIGLVSVTDTPYPELVAAARAIHSGMYRRRYGR
jgi:agarase